jgi:hypothetical protein
LVQLSVNILALLVSEFFLLFVIDSFVFVAVEFTNLLVVSFDVVLQVFAILAFRSRLLLLFICVVEVVVI